RAATPPAPASAPEAATAAALSGPGAVAQAAALPGAEAQAGTGSSTGVLVHIGLTVPADAAGLATAADLAGVSVGPSAPVSADGDRDDPKQLPPIPRIPQQSDRRTALDGERRPHFQ
ncbi:MAG TPA: hypothetical protein VMG38_14765, partial [Trebonia sp.]|nr:hypothetical protein [Trebonia sp.]